MGPRLAKEQRHTKTSFGVAQRLAPRATTRGALLKRNSAKTKITHPSTHEAAIRTKNDYVLRLGTPSSTRKTVKSIAFIGDAWRLAPLVNKQQFAKSKITYVQLTPTSHTLAGTKFFIQVRRASSYK